MLVAPMSGITDQAFRAMFLKHGRPAVFWTEFVSAKGLFSKGKSRCLDILKFDKKEHPIVAQVFGADPLYFGKTAKLLMELGFDGIDINMGCPNRNIEKSGSGAILIKNPSLAKKIIQEIKKEAPGFAISVKTRIGYKKNEIEEWIKAILEEEISALTVHFRTREELFCPPAHWELAKDIIELRNKYSPDTLIIGNGDVKSLEQANNLIKETGLDGVMIGRGAFGNPWLFSGKEPTKQERLKAIIDHAKIFYDFNKKEIKQEGKYNAFEKMKKHFCAYCKGFDNAKDLREQLMKTKNFKEVEEIIKNYR